MCADHLKNIVIKVGSDNLSPDMVDAKAFSESQRHQNLSCRAALESSSP